MKEDLLHFIWQSRVLLNRELRTVGGEAVRVLHTGTINTDAGPDFFNARVLIGGTLWAGNVEMHIESAMWDAHHHQHDRRYENVVLHVVYRHNRKITDSTGREIPTLELSQFIPPLMLGRYTRLQQSRSTVPCEPVFKMPAHLTMINWLERLLIGRIEEKCEHLHRLLHETNMHWNEAFYRLTARCFGMKTNADAFETLAASIPLHVIARNAGQPELMTALLFGTAGLIRAEDTPMLQASAHLQNKYGLTTMDARDWKFSRMRPANFPTVRLQQLSVLLSRSPVLLPAVLAADTLQELKNIYECTGMGRNAAELMLINSALPVLFCYGKAHHEPALCERTVEFYHALGAEDNAITRFWQKLGITASSAADSQALIHMNTNYCNKLRCLSCPVGHEVMLNPTDENKIPDDHCPAPHLAGIRPA